MKHTLKYIFSICLVLSLFLAQAQETTPVKNEAESKQVAKAIFLTTVKMPEKLPEAVTKIHSFL